MLRVKEIILIVFSRARWSIEWFVSFMVGIFVFFYFDVFSVDFFFCIRYKVIFFFLLLFLLLLLLLNCIELFVFFMVFLYLLFIYIFFSSWFDSGGEILLFFGDEFLLLFFKVLVDEIKFLVVLWVCMLLYMLFF